MLLFGRRQRGIMKPETLQPLAGPCHCAIYEKGKCPMFFVPTALWHGTPDLV